MNNNDVMNETEEMTVKMNLTNKVDEAEATQSIDQATWKDVIEIIEWGEEAAKELNIGFSRSYSKDMITMKNVKISLPKPGAKYLMPVIEHNLIAFEDENLESVIRLEIPAHYQNGDFVSRNRNGSLRPTVARHFFIGPEHFGSFIIANITVSKKTDILSGQEMININISPVRKNGRVAVLKNYLRNGEPTPIIKRTDGTEVLAEIASAEYELKLGVTENGSPFEVAIPESDKFIRFEKINTLRVIV